MRHGTNTCRSIVLFYVGIGVKFILFLFFYVKTKIFIWMISNKNINSFPFLLMFLLFWNTSSPYWYYSLFQCFLTCDLQSKCVQFTVTPFFFFSLSNLVFFWRRVIKHSLYCKDEVKAIVKEFPNHGKEKSVSSSYNDQNHQHYKNHKNVHQRWGITALKFSIYFTFISSPHKGSKWP